MAELFELTGSFLGTNANRMKFDKIYWCMGEIGCDTLSNRPMFDPSERLFAAERHHWYKGEAFATRDTQIRPDSN
jgi:hypothetical protein